MALILKDVLTLDLLEDIFGDKGSTDVYNLLLEDGSDLLLEDGGLIILERGTP